MTPEMEILEKINSFYSTSFSQLVTYTVAILGFVGIVIPATAAFFQARSLKAEKENLDNLIKQDVESAKDEVKKDIESIIEKTVSEKVSEMISAHKKDIERLDKEICGLRSIVSHSNAMGHIENNRIPNAISDSCSAIRGYLESGDEMNLRRVLHVFTEIVLKNANSKIFEDEDVEKNIQSAIDILEINNENDRYYDAIRAIRLAVKDAKSRNNEKNADSGRTTPKGLAIS